MRKEVIWPAAAGKQGQARDDKWSLQIRVGGAQAAAQGARRGLGSTQGRSVGGAPQRRHDQLDRRHSSMACTKFFELMQRVARAYYEPRFIVILDLLAYNNMMRDEDLAKALKIPPADLWKLCLVLRNDGLIHSKTEEIKEYRHMKKITHSHYFIDYKRFVNVVKYRMLKVQQTIQAEVDSRRYNPMSALALMRPTDGLFICEVCGSELNLEDADREMEIPDFVPIAAATSAAPVSRAENSAAFDPQNIKVELEGFKPKPKLEAPASTDDKDADIKEYYARLGQSVGTSAVATPAATGDTHGGGELAGIPRAGAKRVADAVTESSEPTRKWAKTEVDSDVEEIFEEVI
ncbi:hypothetical protein HK405_008354, partial [Cladochytrium tenue]